MKRLMVLAMFFLFLMTACGDSGHSYNGKGSLPPPADTSCCPTALDAEALLCGQCTRENPCKTARLNTTIICDDNLFWTLEIKDPNISGSLRQDWINAPSRGNPYPPDACCPAEQCGVFTFWCTPDIPCPTNPESEFSIYYQPDLYDIPEGTFNWWYSPGWKLRELDQFGPQSYNVWPIYPNKKG
jgi:hypothetical protein